MEQKYFKDHRYFLLYLIIYSPLNFKLNLRPATNGVIDLDKFKRRSSGSVADSSSNSKPPTDLPGAYRYLWIRVALFEKLLAIIVDFLANNARLKTNVTWAPSSKIQISFILASFMKKKL